MNIPSAQASHPIIWPNLVYIIGTYPRLTTTFIDREVCSLRQLGVNLRIFSIRRPTESLPEEQLDLQTGVTYLLPVSLAGFCKGQLRFVLRQPRAYLGTLLALLGAPHSSLRARFMTLLHFAEGVALADLIGRSADGAAPAHLHAHFADRAATAALVASRLLGIPYSLTAHANDIYVQPQLLPEKIGRARFVATCTQYNQAYLNQIGAGRFNGKMKCIYHGIDLDQYRPRVVPAGGAPVLLAVGQLKEKKGYIYLIKACRILKDLGLGFRCEIVGEGPLREALQAEIDARDLSGTVELCGALHHPQVIHKYRSADIFVTPSILAADGDRDGIPNVILEAMAMQLPVAATLHSGIPEVVVDGVNGLLVPPADEVALAEALARLIGDGGLRRRLGLNGRKTVLEKFDIRRNAERLLAEFSLA
jgi:glycosyltransferase involved in cell wall biosynthesis